MIGSISGKHFKPATSRPPFPPHALHPVFNPPLPHSTSAPPPARSTFLICKGLVTAPCNRLQAEVLFTSNHKLTSFGQVTQTIHSCFFPIQKPGPPNKRFLNSYGFPCAVYGYLWRHPNRPAVRS
ncbi:hypothetical protein CDAR_168221 [Caerostris darwini]|uniref:Uncharacterized protein n=1 Tax=Caerostris darwini TaxID=1538125 RepID=A0AAV4T5H5_9ARAC|nr:hypothetical protein CDAR_168221 [Caerostris darwini]